MATLEDRIGNVPCCPNGPARLTPEQKEWRRLRALELKTAGWKQKDIAAALGVTTGAVCQWVKRAEEGGDSGREALRRRKAPGGKATEKLPRPHLLAHLTRLLESAPQEGAEAFGFIGKQWTLSRVQVALAETLGVLYHRSHVHRLLRQAGFTPQLPETKATQRDEERIKEFRGREWRRLKRGHEEQVDA